MTMTQEHKEALRRGRERARLEGRMGKKAAPAQSAVDKKLDALIGAQTKLIEALDELIVKLSNPLVAAQMVHAAASDERARELPAGNPVGTSREAQLEEPAPEIEAQQSSQPTPPERDVLHFNGPATPDSYDDMVNEFTAMADELEEPPPPPDETQVWDLRLRVFRRANVWDPSWGPRPGQDGCRVPQGA